MSRRTRILVVGAVFVVLCAPIWPNTTGGVKHIYGKVPTENGLEYRCIDSEDLRRTDYGPFWEGNHCPTIGSTSLGTAEWVLVGVGVVGGSLLG